MQRLRLLNETYKDSEKFLNVIYSQKDNKTGSTIFHEADFITLREINKTLKPYPELLSKFYFSQNNLEANETYLYSEEMNLSGLPWYQT